MSNRKTLPYHRRYHGDALQGYTKLDLEERGAYTTILDLIYDAGGPIEYNDRWLAGQWNCSLRKMKALLSRLLTLQKLYITTDGKISNHRCERELEQTEINSRKQAEKRIKPRKVAPETWRNSYGLARQTAPKTSRKQVENDLKLSQKARENLEKLRENNESAQPQLINGSTLPEPEPDNKLLGKVDEDTGALKNAGSGRPPPMVDDTGHVVTATSPDRLLQGLTRQTDGARQLQGLLAHQRESSNRWQ